METVTGTISAIIYTKETTGYAVLRLSADDGAVITVVGCVPQPVPGETIQACGQWITHQSFGKQFEIATGGCERQLPATETALLAYLKSGALRGVGASTAKAMVDKFGVEILGVIEHTPGRLTELKGISPKRAEAIGRAFREQNGVRRMIEFLAIHSLPPQHALTLYKQYGPDAMQALKDNPYILVRPPFEVEFMAADAMAMTLGLETDDHMRLEAAILFELYYNLEQGHCYIPYDKLLDVSRQLLDLDDADMEDALAGLVDDGDIIMEEIGGKTACYLTDVYMAECNVTTRVLQMSALPPETPEGLMKRLETVESELGLTLAAEQRQAVLVAAKSKLFVLTGGPGTGKTTTVRAIVGFFEQQECEVALAAPTGRAAKRLGEVCARSAKTIHRMLGVCPDPATGLLGFAYDADNPLPYDVVIVDETSMVDVQLFDALLAAIASDARLILVGDQDQLPAVGPGNVLGDLLSCYRVDCVRLERVFRQAAQSEIVTGAHAVNEGELPTLTNQGDLFWMTRTQADAAVDTLIELCTKRLPDNMGVPTTNIQVLTPTRRGIGGTQHLNEALQEAVNPPSDQKQERRHGHTVFREGDRVMQIRNNYDILWQLEEEQGSGVFNGDIGHILTVERRQEIITVRFEDGRLVRYTFEQLGELELAYAMTVHKAQGSEYPAVVLVLLPCSRNLLNRRVLYTAMTRARDLLVMVGDKSVLSAMVNTKRGIGRYSGLKFRLQD